MNEGYERPDHDKEGGWSLDTVIIVWVLIALVLGGLMLKDWLNN